MHVKELRRLVLSFCTVRMLGIVNFWMVKFLGYGICLSHHKETRRRRVLSGEAKWVDLAYQINSGEMGVSWTVKPSCVHYSDGRRFRSLAEDVIRVTKPI